MKAPASATVPARSPVGPGGPKVTDARPGGARSREYYEDKLDSLRDLFGRQDVRLAPGGLRVGGAFYPIVNDVIVLLEPEKWPPSLRNGIPKDPAIQGFAPDIQLTFGEEWRRFPDIVPEHRREFDQYFDLVDLASLRGRRVCDLGCGIGRWSLFLAGHCAELVLVDFSEAIFVARRNLASAPRVLFFLADLQALPFRPKFADFLVCLGVLHHLPTPALDEVRKLRKHAPRSLVYLYYALDNRAAHQRALLRAVTRLRLFLSSRWDPRFRDAVTWLIAVGVYAPLVALGAALRPFGLGRHVPLYEGYRGKSLDRMRQDVYDRFFTRIEQRFTKRQILALRDTFQRVTVSENLPYWHFLIENGRDEAAP